MARAKRLKLMPIPSPVWPFEAGGSTSRVQTSLYLYCAHRYQHLLTEPKAGVCRFIGRIDPKSAESALFGGIVQETTD